MDNLFRAPDLLERLEGLTAAGLDALPFGLIAMTPEGIVSAYNQAEASLSGLTPARVIGRHFFTSVAPCTYNYLVAHRFENEQTLDLTIDYVFTFRMVPMPVELRMLKHPDMGRMYLAVQRREKNDAG